MPKYKDLVLFDFSSNSRTVKKGQLLIVEHRHPRFAAIKLGTVKSASHGHHYDEMEFDYHIYYDELLDGRINKKSMISKEVEYGG